MGDHLERFRAPPAPRHHLAHRCGVPGGRPRGDVRRGAVRGLRPALPPPARLPLRGRRRRARLNLPDGTLAHRGHRGRNPRPRPAPRRRQGRDHRARHRLPQAPGQRRLPRGLRQGPGQARPAPPGLPPALLVRRRRPRRPARPGHRREDPAPVRGVLLRPPPPRHLACAGSAPPTATCGRQFAWSSAASATEDGLPHLGLPGLGGIYDDTPTDTVLAGLELSNEQLLTAVKSLSRVRDKSTNRWRRIDYRNLGAEELGAIYESLLELVPDRDGQYTFVLRDAAGNDRKSTGSYYTPTSLIDCLLDSTLDPVLDDATKQAEIAATAAGTDVVGGDRRGPAVRDGLRPGLRLRPLPRRGGPTHRQARRRRPRAQPRTNPGVAPHRSPRRHHPLRLRRRPQPDGRRTREGLPLAGGPGPGQATVLPRRPRQARQRPDRRDTEADRRGHPRRRVQAGRGRRPEVGDGALAKTNEKQRTGQGSLFELSRTAPGYSQHASSLRTRPDYRSPGRRAARRPPARPPSTRTGTTRRSGSARLEIANAWCAAFMWRKTRTRRRPSPTTSSRR